MSSKQPKHLFVVKEGTSATAGRMVSAESLSADQLATVKRSISLAQAQGVLVGAFVTPQAWDIRPLLLQEGVLHLLRFSNPAIAVQKSRLGYLRASYERIALMSEAKALVGFGEIEGQLWIRRRYFASTVADDEGRGSGIHPLQFAQKLIRLVTSLHRASLIHGHLCPNNLAMDEQELFLLDHSILASALPYEQEIGSLAPELRTSVIPTYAADIYGLGLVLRACSTNELGPEQQLCIERMLSAEPSLRPSLDSIRQTFMPSESQPVRPGSVTSISTQPGIVSGRVIPSAARQPEPTPASRPEHPPKIITPQVPLVRPNQLPEWRREESPAVVASTPPSAVTALDPPPSIPAPSSSSSFLVILAIAAVVALGTYYYTSRDMGSPSDMATLVTAWSSNQPSMMERVAEAAVEGDADAQLIIVSEALKGINKPEVRSSLIRLAFDSSWERELGQDDRRIILTLGLLRLLPKKPISLPPLGEAHPAVALAIAGDTHDLTMEQGSRELAAVPLSKMARLNPPYGEMFALLEKTGVHDLAELPARGLSHIVSGDASPLAFNAFFSSSETKQKALVKLAILYPLARRVPKVEEGLFSALAEPTNPLADSIAWFASEELAQWSKVPKIDLLGLVAGQLPAGGLSVEQYADLLRSPDIGLREKAKTALVKGENGDKLKSVLQVLSSNSVRLSRFHVISLVSAMQLNGEAGYALLGSVLETNPDPRAILSILIARSHFERLDPVNVELARYVVRANPMPTIEDLQKLSIHPEPLARAFAYSRLDPDDSKQRELLEAAAVVEPSKRLRKQLDEKLAGVTLQAPPPAPEAKKSQQGPGEEETELAPF